MARPERLTGAMDSALSRRRAASPLHSVANIVNLGDSRGMDKPPVDRHLSDENVSVELAYLQESLDEDSSAVLSIERSGQHISLSKNATRALRTILDTALAHAPSDENPPRRITTQQAARILGVSRPFVIKLLDQGEIPFERLGPSRHRRIKLADVIEYQTRMQQVRRVTLATMTEEAFAGGLYDETA